MNSEPKRSLHEIYPRRFDIVLLILASAVLLLVGLKLPVLTVRKLWEGNTFSIVSGIQNLWKEKNEALAMIVLFFSVIFPVVKLVTLLAVWFVKLTESQRKRILEVLSALGKWSMLDVFVIAIIIVTVKLGALASAKAEQGIYYFAVSIFLAMVASSMESYLAQRASSRKEERLTPRRAGS